MLKIKNNQLHNDRTSQIVSWGHWFTLFNIFLVIALGSRYLFIADWPATFLGRVYAVISCIGHFSFLAFVIYLITLFPLSFFISSVRWQRIIAILIATISISLLLIDIEIFTRFRMHLSFSLWQILTSPDDNILSAKWQRLFIFVPFMLLLQTLFAIWSWRKLRSLTKRRRLSYPFIAIFVICFLSSHLIHIWADANFYRPITMQRSSLPLSYPLTARHLLERYGFIQSGDYNTRIEQEGNPFAIAVEYPLGKISYQKSNHPYNILMITVDEWNEINQQKTMPIFSKFAHENIEFTSHYSASTKDYLGQFSLFYGLDPNYYQSILASHKSSALIDTLTKQHYNIGLFASDGFNHALYRYALLLNFSIPETNKISSVQATTDYWLTWHKEQTNTNASPWFSIIEYRKSPKQNKVGDASLQFMKNIDNSLAKILEEIKTTNQQDNTIIIVTASNKQQQHANTINFNREDLHVPLAIAWPNKENQTFNEVTTHVDIMQTIMQNALGVTNTPTQYSQGQNLFDSTVRKWITVGDEMSISALYQDKVISINNSGQYQIFDKSGNYQNHEKLGLSTFLQLVTQNRRFMVTN
ncbi:DUF3413 domain-containing protein [Orbaceae bacterium ac157xtp]